MNFDEIAASWDEEPRRLQLAKDIANSILSEVDLDSGMNALDFGCGTGLLTLPLASLVRSITGMDTSRGMLDVLQTKIDRQNIANVSPQFLDLEKGDVLEGHYDVIISSMTFHHIPEIKPLLIQFYNRLNPSGRLCIADLDPEGGLFHSSNEGIFHFGFDRAALAKELERVGFSKIRHRTAATITKPAADGKEREFTVFLVVGQKVSD